MREQPQGRFKLSVLNGKLRKCFNPLEWMKSVYYHTLPTTTTTSFDTIQSQEFGKIRNWY